MHGFVKCLMKFAVIFSIGLAIVLLVITGLLIFVPGILMNIIYFCLLLACLVGVLSVVGWLIRCFIKRPKK